MKKKKLIAFIIVFVLIIYACVCFYAPEHAESIAKGFAAILGGFDLFI